MPSTSIHQLRLHRPVAIAAAIVAALAGAPAAQAQSSATMYGLIDMSAGSFQSPGNASKKAVESGNMSTSYWGIKGAEDLGGGLSAQFVLESFMRNDTGLPGRFNSDAFFARNSWVGLAGQFGSVTLGRNTTSLFVNTLVFNAFGDSFGFSPTIRHYFTSGVSQVSGDTGWSDSVKYNSPKFGGLSFNATVAAGEGNGGRNLAGSAMYFDGPLGLGLAWQKVEKGATDPDTTTWQASGSYKLGDAKLFAQYGVISNKTTDIDYKLTDLGGEYALGLGKVLLQWGHISPDSGPSKTTVSLGYDYQMSKRTDVYAVYMSEHKSGLSNGSSYAVGVRHRF
jgi:predicted porin